MRRRVSGSSGQAEDDAEQALAHGAFQRDANQLLRFDSKFHRQFLNDVPDEAVDDQRDRGFFGNATLQAVEQLILEILDVVASCSKCAEAFFASM